MTPERKLYWQLKLAYNLLMLAVAWLTSIALIQHAAFIYTWPPDLGKWLQVPWSAYLLLAGVLWIGYKLLHYTEVKAEVALKRLIPASMGCSPPTEKDKDEPQKLTLGQLSAAIIVDRIERCTKGDPTLKLRQAKYFHELQIEIDEKLAPLIKQFGPDADVLTLYHSGVDIPELTTNMYANLLRAAGISQISKEFWTMKKDSPLTPHGILIGFSTSDLVEELKLREGVEYIKVDVCDSSQILVNRPGLPQPVEKAHSGPAVILRIID